MRIIYDTIRKVGHTDNKLKTTDKHIFISTIFTMKNNNLFRKFLALFLTGTMLAGVGCKDYDDDIDDINKKIDDLNAKVELKADASALQTISDKLKDVDFSKFVTNAQLDTKLAGYVESSKLVDEVKKLGYKTEKEILDLIANNTLDQAAIDKLIEAQFTFANIWTKEVQAEVQKLIETEIGKIEGVTAADLATIKTEIIKAINDDKEVDGIRKAISNMVGSGFSQYMAEYIKDNQDIWAGQVGDAAIAAIDAAGSELKEKILGMISEDGTFLEQDDLTQTFAEYDKKITAIWSAIDDLAGRIQSIVFVPTEVGADYDVNFGGSYIADTKPANNIPLASSPKVKIAFRVAPAALAGTLAEQINEGEVKVSFIPEEVEEVKTRAAEAEAPVTYEGDVVAEDGKLIFTAVADEALYEELKEEGKTYAVALCLKQDAKKNEDGNGYKYVGFEIVSPYISTTGASADVKANFVLAKADEEDKLVEYTDAAVYPLVWNSTETIVLLSDYQLAYKDGEEILSLEDAAAKYLWDADVAEKLAFAYTHKTVAYSGNAGDFTNQTQLTIDPKDPTKSGDRNKQITVKNNAAKQSVDNVGDVFTVTDDLTITFDKKSIAWLSGIKSQVEITGDKAAELTEIDGVVNWEYATYAADNTYSFTVTVPADKAMDWEMFNELPASIDAEVAALPKDSKLVLDGQDVPAVTIAPVKMLNAESAQQLTVTVAKWLNGNGEVTFTAAPKVGSTETFVNISGKVTFNGLPAFPYEIKNEGAKVGDNYEISFEKVNETFFDKQYFADKAAVATFLKNLTLDYSGVTVAANDKVTPIVLPAEITLVDGATLKLAFDDANINWEKQPSYTYTVPTGTGKGSIVSDNKAFEIKLTGSYTLTNEIFSLKANDLYLKPGAAGKNPFIELNAGVKDNAVVLNAIDLKRAYDMTEEAKAAGATVKYTLVKDNDDYKTYESVYGKGDASKWPSISGSSMSWQNFILSSCTVKAELFDKNDKLCATEEFDVTLVDPINFDSWNFFQGGEVILPAAGETAATFNIVNKVLAMSTDGREPGEYKENNKPVTVVAVARDVLGNEIYTKNEDDYTLSTLATATNGYGFFYKNDENKDLYVEYGELKWATSPIVGVTFDNKTGVITAVASNESVAATTATIDVTYRYRFAYEPTTDDKGKVTGYEMKPFTKSIKISFKK